MNAFVHTATDSNTPNNWMEFENPLADNEHKLVFIMPRGIPDDNNMNIIDPIGVWYTGLEWAIFNHVGWRWI